MAKRKKLRKRGRTPILNLGPGAARKFLLKGGSYCRFPLPKYLVFDSVLREVSNYLTNHGFTSVTDKPREHTRVNHTILDNKDGLYAWRPMELIHPALYVNLVHRITEPANWKQLRRRFAALTKEDRIRCTSIPVEGTKRGRQARAPGPRSEGPAVVGGDGAALDQACAGVRLRVADRHYGLLRIAVYAQHRLGYARQAQRQT